MTTSHNKWLLPDGVEELLPDQAWQVEQMRRRVLDIFSSNGYQLVQPPLLEFIDSLLSGAGHDLDLLTFKVTDQHSGRMMGVRADMTPQLSRIDAHVLDSDTTQRLCYAGPVLQTAHRSGFHSREPIQFGAEIFGCDSIQADVEVIRLCNDVLTAIGINQLRFDLGHVGIFNTLVAQAGLDDLQIAMLLDICQRKSWPDMDQFIEQQKLDDQISVLLRGLLQLEGKPEQVFPKASNLFKDCDQSVQDQLKDFKCLCDLIIEYLPDVSLSVDFLELRGINYHTAAVFSVYCTDYANAIAKGGRYDEIGRAFGKARAATGFSADLRQAFLVSSKRYNEQSQTIYAPFDSDPELKEFIDQSRASGLEIVIRLDSDQIEPDELQITKQNGQWKINDEI